MAVVQLRYDEEEEMMYFHWMKKGDFHQCGF